MSDTTTKTPFPERMWAMSTATHTACAAKALDEIASQAASIRREMETGRHINTTAVRDLAGLAVTAGIHLSALEELRETREWDEAERNGEQS